MPRSQIMEDSDTYGGEISTYGLSKDEKVIANNITNLQLMEDVFGHRGYSHAPRNAKLILREMD